MKPFTIFNYTVIKTADLLSLRSNESNAVKFAKDKEDSAVVARAKRILAEQELAKCKVVLGIKNEQIASISKKPYTKGRFEK